MTDRTELSSTEKQLREALKRLIDKQPTHRELKRKLSANKLKIVVANVEKEAGLSNGAAKRYPETKKMKAQKQSVFMDRAMCQVKLCVLTRFISKLERI